MINDKTLDAFFDAVTGDEKQALVDDMKMKLPDGRTITFNKEQYVGIQKIRKWLKGNEKFFTLAGYAGTGKTTIIKKIIDEYRRSLVVSAPTHKAKKVIMKTTKQDGVTLHSILGLRPDLDLDDFNPNDPKFNPIAKPTMDNYSFIIIDEASMINEELFKLLREEVKRCRRKIKILFMGDPAQIPPVGEKESVVFEAEDIKIHELTQVMRQEDGNPLAPIYDVLRNNLNKITGGVVRKTELNSKGEGIIYTNNRKDFREKLIKTFTSEAYAKDLDHAKLIAWRNVTVMQSNQIIRDQLFGRNADILEVNDVLMAYRSVKGKHQYLNIIDNSGDYRVMKVSKRCKNHFGLDGYEVNLREPLGTGEFRFQDVFIIDHTNHDNLHDYAEMHDLLKTIAKQNKKKWKDYYVFRRESLLMKTIEDYRQGGSREYGEKIIKDLDYGYAITGHKSQGSTYTNIFLLEDDMDINPIIRERNQIKYVALTRPTTTATILSYYM